MAAPAIAGDNFIPIELSIKETRPGSYTARAQILLLAVGIGLRPDRTPEKGRIERKKVLRLADGLSAVTQVT